jgi:hypothetical protein
MVEDMPDDEGPAPDSGRAKRAPPTIDLEASEVSGETRKVDDDVQPERISEEPSSQASSSQASSSQASSSQEPSGGGGGPPPRQPRPKSMPP